MRASKIVLQFCGAMVQQVHAARLRLLLAAVDALVLGNRLTLTELGRALPTGALAKHRIKAVDRLLGNSRMQRDVPRLYGALARRVLRGNRRPFVLVDWTQTMGDFNALVAAVAFSGRAIPIYAEVHPGFKLGNREVQRRFLARLAAVLPRKTRPIVVADAGFKTPFFDAVRDLNWNFVIRLRGKGVLRKMSEHVRLRDPRMSFETAFALALDHPQCLGNWTPYAAAGALGPAYRIVLAKRPLKADDRPRTDPYARRSVEPWLLATDLEHATASQIVSIYAMRMQIELTFRDAKNGRMGWGLKQARSKSASRQSVLLLIASLALAATLLAGAFAESAGEAAKHQANTIRSRRVLSLYRLGIFALTTSLLFPRGTRALLAQRQKIPRFVRTGLQQRLPFTTLHYGKFR